LPTNINNLLLVYSIQFVAARIPHIGIRAFSEASNTFVRWKEYPVDGHYAVMKTPNKWLKGAQEFFHELPK
jgi:hypothetical protein